MFLACEFLFQSRSCFLHVRGGVSISTGSGVQSSMFSPRAWRCFYHSDTSCCMYAVFSTCVEVFPDFFRLIPVCCGFLHVRGGVSFIVFMTNAPTRFSPRAWRCFQTYTVGAKKNKVFSTCVEVFLPFSSCFHTMPRFLHVRGGVSGIVALKFARKEFSPRAWRCFYERVSSRKNQIVFSTCVEVFLSAPTALDA